MSKGLRGVMVFLAIVWMLPASVSAQTSVRASLLPPNLSRFPQVEVYLDIRDDQNQFLPGLEAEQIQVLEDDQPLSAESLELLRPGVQIVTVIQPGTSFTTPTQSGETRAALLTEVLANWAKSRQGSTVDDWSLMVGSERIVSHVNNPMDWLEKLWATSLEPGATPPSLAPLQAAIEMAGEQQAKDIDSGRSVLFISAPVAAEDAATLQNLITNANQKDVHIFVWMVSAPGSVSSQAAASMTQLAESTGGAFMSYSGEEALPNPEDYFAGMRRIYRLTYTSRLQASGDHRLKVQISLDPSSEPIQTEEQPLKLNILPPNPAFISPPLEIIRRVPEDSNPADEAETLAALTPALQEIQILMDFPDGRVRPLTRTTLWVDGQIVQERTSPPFDRFEWDLSGYTSSGSHLIQVQAVDSQGMTGASIEQKVNVRVELPPANPWKAAARSSPILLGLSLLVVGSVIFLALLLGGKIQPNSLTSHKTPRRKTSPSSLPPTAPPEPVTSSWANKLLWPQRRVAPQASAFLTPIQDEEISAPGSPIPITADELTLGSDPNQASLVLNDPTVEPLHARLLRQEDGNFLLRDEGSIAGTWVNYLPLSSEPLRLKHGDQVGIGRLGFRFTLRQPGPLPKPLILPIQEPTLKQTEEPL